MKKILFSSILATAAALCQNCRSTPPSPPVVEPPTASREPVSQGASLHQLYTPENQQEILEPPVDPDVTVKLVPDAQGNELESIHISTRIRPPANHLEVRLLSMGQVLGTEETLTTAVIFRNPERPADQVAIRACDDQNCSSPVIFNLPEMSQVDNPTALKIRAANNLNNKIMILAKTMYYRVKAGFGPCETCPKHSSCREQAAFKRAFADGATAFAYRIATGSLDLDVVTHSDGTVTIVMGSAEQATSGGKETKGDSDLAKSGVIALVGAYLSRPTTRQAVGAAVGSQISSAVRNNSGDIINQRMVRILSSNAAIAAGGMLLAVGSGWFLYTLYKEDPDQLQNIAKDYGHEVSKSLGLAETDQSKQACAALTSLQKEIASILIKLEDYRAQAAVLQSS